ncbi:MAG TPA: hypothetical protein VEA44_00215 [Caulobacter sp.]|nr:hypothetical protein [Caulobacter sp.]
MKTLAIAAAGFAAAFAIAGAAPAQAQETPSAFKRTSHTCPAWRCGFNGLSLNGVNFNGIGFNGMKPNGVRVNGQRLNGAAADGQARVVAVRLPAGKRVSTR